MAPGLRPVPFRPPGPVDPEEAARHVAAALPDLDEVAQRALALAEVAGRPRQAVAAELALDLDAAGAALQRARKALRRAGAPLSATGWCERAERLLSDDLDGVLEPPGPERLATHLRHCGRCVEHERRLAQARDALVHRYAELHGEPEPEPEAESPAPAARLRIVPEAGLPALEPPAEEPEALEPPEEEPEALEPPAEESEALEPPADPPDPALPFDQPGETDDGPPDHAAREATQAAAAKPDPGQPPVPRVTLGIASHGNVAWAFLHVSAVLLALAAAALTVLAATGTIERVF